MRIVGAILAVIGILLVSLGGYLFVREQIFLHSAEQATAVVTNNESVSYTGNINEMGIQRYYCSAFQFRTRDGQTISFKEAEGKLNRASCGDLNSAPDHKVGETVPVYYDARDPADSAQIPKPVKKYYTYALTIALIGLLIVSIGAFFLWESEQTRKRQAARRRKTPGSHSANPGWDKQLQAEKEMKKRK